MSSLSEIIKRKVNIVDFVSENVSLTKKSQNYVGLCPFHDDHSPSFFVNETKQIYKCFSCNNGGDVIAFYQHMNHLDNYRTALFKLAEQLGIRGQSSSVATPFNRQLKCNELCRDYWKNNLQSQQGQSALNYLKKRGLTTQIINKYQLGYAHDDQKIIDYLEKCGYDLVWLEKEGYLNSNNKFFFAHRIIFPIMHQTTTVGFIGRLLTKATKYKYLLSPEKPWFQKNQLFYGLSQAEVAIKRHKKVILVEGNMDAISLSQCGFEHSLALMGLHLTAAHLQQIKQWGCEVILYLDNDDQGIAAGYTMASQCLNKDISVSIVVNTGTKDAADLLATGQTDLIKQQLAKPDPAILFFINHLQLQTDPETLIKQVRQILHLINCQTDLVAKQTYLQKLSTKTKINLNYLPTAKSSSKSEQRKLVLPAKQAKLEMQMIVFLLLKKQLYQLPRTLSKFLNPVIVEMVTWISQFYEQHLTAKKVPPPLFNDFCHETSLRKAKWEEIQYFWQHHLLTSYQNQSLKYYEKQLHQLALYQAEQKVNETKLILDESHDQGKIIEFSNNIVNYHKKRKELENE